MGKSDYELLTLLMFLESTFELLQSLQTNTINIFSIKNNKETAQESVIQDSLSNKPLLDLYDLNLYIDSVVHFCTGLLIVKSFSPLLNHSTHFK